MADSTVMEHIVKCIENKRNFILDAGAGSGKTYTLIESLNYLIDQNGKQYKSTGQKIACITYTNVAVDEIKNRISSGTSVHVSTIHGFLWSIIGKYQKELQEALILINNKAGNKWRIDNLEERLIGKRIEYVEYRKIEDGKISHDDVISISKILFDKYEKLSRVVVDMYPVIFVDEYQDTNENVVQILLDIINHHYGDKVLIGFFGDWMQNIYQSGVGYIDPDKKNLEHIVKKENHRSSKSIVDVINHVRQDIRQVAVSNDAGSATFYYRESDDVKRALNDLVSILQNKNGWGENLKILALTKRIIALNADWNTLYSIYSDYSKEDKIFSTDNLLSGEDPYSKFYEYVENIISAFENNSYGELYRIFKISLGQEKYKNNLPRFKGDLNTVLSKLKILSTGGTIEDVGNYVAHNSIFPKNVGLNSALEGIKNNHVKVKVSGDGGFRYLKDCKYSEVRSMMNYRNEVTPFSTQHGTKGAEYDDVIVVLDNGNWMQYNLESALTHNSNNKKDSVYARSLNILYVSLSRARNNLVVFMMNPDATVLNTACNIFGKSNVVKF
ncbi:UvrD-helicase domain-containing protein [Rothia sp. HMSC065C12]|uniref:UvrD-helicase domain-containing protein n=1 Tax=Rothia sp. HMSC065C12 TaxID=1739340 RepID=UPI00114CE8DD|nr:UvrD-helicase domain-containing protein [Rothia sp. HMSC065C12]